MLKVNPDPPLAEADILPLLLPVALVADPDTLIVTPAQGFGGVPPPPPPLLPQEYKKIKLIDAASINVFDCCKSFMVVFCFNVC